MTAFEKRQAFANAAIEEGLDKFGDVDSEAETAAASLEKLVATLSDIATTTGQFIANAIQPLVEGLGKPVTAVATFGILAKTVFGTAIRELTKGAEDFTIRARTLGDTLTDKLGSGLKGTQIAAAKLTDETRKLNLVTVRASIANREEFATLIKKARAQEISFGETRRLNQIAKEELKLIDRKLLGLKNLTEKTDRQEKELKRLERTQKSFNRTLDITNARLNSTSKLVRGAATGVRGFSVAVGIAGTFVAGLLGKVTALITFLSIIAAVGSAILEAFGFLEPVSKFIDDLLRRAAVLLGITKEARQQAEIREQNPGLGGQTTTTRRRGRATITDRGPDLGASAVRVIAEATGQSFKQVIKQIQIAQDGSVKLKAALDLTGPLSKARIIFKDTSDLQGESLVKANKENELQVNRVQSLQVAAKLQEALVSGNATLEQIEKRRGAILAKIANLRKDEDQRNIKTADLLQKELDILNFQAEQQLAILNTRKRLRNEFSAQIKAADNLNKFFILDKELGLDSLKIAKNQDDIQRSRNAQLVTNFKLGKDALEQQRKGIETLTPIQEQLAMLARDAEKALIGSFVKSFEAAKKLDKQLEKILDKESKRLKVAQNQLKVFTAQNNIKVLDTQTKELTKQIKRTNDLAKANESLRVARLKSIEAVRKSERKLADEMLKMNPFLSEADKRNFTLKLDKQSLERLKESIEKQKEALKANQLAEAKILEAQINQQQELISTGEFTGLIEKRINAEKQLQIDKINADEKAALKDIKTLEERNRLLIKELDNFKAHIDGIAQVLANDIVERKILQNAAIDDRAGNQAGTNLRKMLRMELAALGPELAGQILRNAGISGGGGAAPGTSNTFAAANIDTLRKILFEIERSKVADKVKDQLANLKKELKAKDFETIKKAIIDVAEANRKLAGKKGDAKLIAEQSAANEKLKDIQTKLKITGIDLTTALTNLDLKLIDSTNKTGYLTTKTKLLNDNFAQALNAIGKAVRPAFVDGFLQLNDAIIDGTLTLDTFKKGFRSFVGDLIKQIQRIFFTKTIAEPAANALTKFTGDLFGAKTSTPDLSDSFGLDGLSKIASGGLIQRLAAGGSPRDRVPALLEPGEFVMSRRAVSQAGLPAMQQMNAGGTPPISVNIKNEGTPQEATEAQPRFDVDKIVIDVVTRDLRNNGPIRKSLRGGS